MKPTILTIAITTVALTVISAVAWRYRRSCTCCGLDKAIDDLSEDVGDFVQKNEAALQQ